jgi:uncharacterized OsmC-like protein
MTTSIDTTSTRTAPGAAAGVQWPGVRVDHDAGDRFTISVRDHAFLTDQPREAGGEDAAATPTELFVASLASCVAFYARRYLARHRLDATGLAVEATYELGSKPARVTEVRLVLTLPRDFPESRREALLAVAGHCTVHNSITTPPAITLDVDG